MKSRIQKNEKLKQRLDCVFVSFLKAAIDNLIFPGYLFCDPLQLWSQAFLCLATVFGKHTDRRLDSRYDCDCEIDVGENSDSACSVLFRFQSFLLAKI